MPVRITKVLAFALAAVVALAASDAAFARYKKPRHKAYPEPLITRDYDGTPIIMKGFSRTRTAPIQEPSVRHAGRPVNIPRGSSTYIPPPDPSPSGGPPASVLLQPPPSAPPPPRLNTFSDRVTNCIHSFPLQGGIGNNPSDQQAYIRQCAN
jgi:hypothetical protein